MALEGKNKIKKVEKKGTEMIKEKLKNQKIGIAAKKAMDEIFGKEKKNPKVKPLSSPQMKEFWKKNSSGVISSEKKANLSKPFSANRLKSEKK